MEFQIIKQLFLLFSDEPDWEPYKAIIDLAITEIGKIIVPDYDRSDLRLNFLCAAMANYRLQQIKASHSTPKYTYAGKIYNPSQNAVLAYAERILRDYFQMCEDLLNEKPFVFMSFSGGEEKLND